MAAEIKKKHGVVCQLIQGRGGVFDVVADGELIFSKHEQGRFPEHAEVLDKLAAKKS